VIFSFFSICLCNIEISVFAEPRRTQQDMALFRQAFDGIHDKLVDEMEVEGLWTHLQSRKVLSERQLRACKSEVIHVTVTALDRLIILLDMKLNLLSAAFDTVDHNALTTGWSLAWKT